jgi:hypothetical protein
MQKDNLDNSAKGLDSAELRNAAAEYDAAPDDASWEPPHPIFRLAQENDDLRKQRDELLNAAKQIKNYLRSQNFDAGMRDGMAFLLETAIAKVSP